MRRAAVLAAVLAAMAAGATDLDEEQGLRAPLAAGGRLEIDNTLGEVVVRGGDGTEVIAHILKSVEDADGDDEARRLLDDVRVDLEETPEGVVLRTTAPGILSWRHADYRVRLEVETPRQVDLVVRVDVGRVEVESIRGKVALTTDVGEVVVRGVDGAIDARTRVGQLEAELVGHNGSDSLVFETNIGEVDVTLPAQIRGQLEVAADIGDVDCEFDLGDERAPASLGRSLRGPVNGGGPTIRAQASIGRVRVRAGR